MSSELLAAVAAARTMLLDPEKLVLGSAGGHLKGQNPRWRRVECRPVRIKAGDRLQVTEFDQTQAHTRNVEWGSPAAKAIDGLLAEPFGHWHIATTDGEFGFRVSKSGKVLTTRTQQPREQQTTHDRVKDRMVDPAERFLFELGVTTEGGRVKAGRLDKYHQIDTFVRMLDAAVDDAVAAGRLSDNSIRLVDLGCGNAYLTFAAFHHLSTTRKFEVEIVGADVKEQSRRHNEAVSQRLRWSDHVSFVTAAISDVEVSAPVDVVLALHACDTATDDALARAIGWRAPLILAAPCCHHDIQRQLRQHEPPSPYGLVTRYGLMRERLGDVLTDSIRASLLRQSGYRADVIEFVDTRHTPRNTLIRAHLTEVPPSPDLVADYQSLVEDWHIHPHLATLL
ncbi:MAG: SAM-dependent methyltransferase [Candidatus Nanopelagicales bacterium]